jgi:[FeFe] hydrogenase H-cluster maturation GTPase HydF
MLETPRGLRLHIGVFGRRNVGKSSLVNALVGQSVSIVSDVAGTTTDPVLKTLEMAPIGPVVFIDTAGVDDVGALGEMRKKKTEEMLDRADVALLVTDGEGLGAFEEGLIAVLRERQTRFAVVFNKADLGPAPDADLAWLKEAKIDAVAVSAAHGDNIGALKETVAKLAPDDWFDEPHLVGDLLPPGELALLVVPIDLGAPKGRLIMPQIQVIREALDSDAMCMVVKERELTAALDRLPRPPKLVICDSQVVLKASADTPVSIPLTTFSILMARFKGDLVKLARGAAAIDRLQPGDRVLIAESCSHHSLSDDIGRVKIPRWLRQYAGGNLEIDVKAGNDFPDDLTPYKLIVHCGGCTINRKHMMTRIFRADRQGVPITNYGLAISLVQGVLARSLECFPAAHRAFLEARAAG